MSYGATDGGDMEDDDIGLMDNTNGSSSKIDPQHAQGGESRFLKMWNMIPNAFPFFSTIIYAFQLISIVNTWYDVNSTVNNLRHADVRHAWVVNEFQQYQMTCFHAIAITNFIVLASLYCTMGTGMQRLCNFLDDFEEYHNFQGLTHWTIFVIERTLELLVLLDYVLIICSIFFYLVWVAGYFMTSVFDGTCDYTDATSDLLTILVDDVSAKFDDIDDTILCKNIVAINLDTAIVMTDCVFVVACQIMFMLIVVELHKKSQHIMHEHMYDDEELDVITGVIQAKTTTVEEEQESDDDEEAPKAPAVVSDEPEDIAETPVEEPAEEEAPEEDQEEFVEEEEIM